MTINELIRKLCSLEGKKKQVEIGNMRETLKCLRVLCEDKEAFKALLKYLWGIK